MEPDKIPAPTTRAEVDQRRNQFAKHADPDEAYEITSEPADLITMLRSSLTHDLHASNSKELKQQILKMYDFVLDNVLNYNFSLDSISDERKNKNAKVSWSPELLIDINRIQDRIYQFFTSLKVDADRENAEVMLKDTLKKFVQKYASKVDAMPSMVLPDDDDVLVSMNNLFAAPTGHRRLVVLGESHIDRKVEPIRDFERRGYTTVYETNLEEPEALMMFWFSSAWLESTRRRKSYESYKFYIDEMAVQASKASKRDPSNAVIAAVLKIIVRFRAASEDSRTIVDALEASAALDKAWMCFSCTFVKIMRRSPQRSIAAFARKLRVPVMPYLPKAIDDGSMRLRETFWIKNLNKVFEKTNRILLVVGDDHREPFVDSLKKVLDPSIDIKTISRIESGSPRRRATNM